MQNYSILITKQTSARIPRAVGLFVKITIYLVFVNHILFVSIH